MNFKKAIVILFLFAFVGCNSDVENRKKMMNLLSADIPKSDLRSNCNVNFDKITNIDLKRIFGSIHRADEFFGDNVFYGKTSFFLGGKAIYHDLVNLIEGKKGVVKRYYSLRENLSNMGRGIFYHKKKIYFFQETEGIKGVLSKKNKYYLSEYSIKKGKVSIKKLYSLQTPLILEGEEWGVKNLKIHACVDNKLYISGNFSEKVTRNNKAGDIFILLYDLKTKKARLIGKYGFLSEYNLYFRIIYAGKKVIIVSDMSGIYAIDLFDGSIIYRYEINLMSPLAAPGRKTNLYNIPVYYDNVLYLIIPLKKERATRILRIDKSGEKIMYYIPSSISIVARDKNRIFFVEANYFLNNSGGYDIKTSEAKVAHINCFNLKTMKTEWRKMVKTKVGGGMGAPLLIKDKIVACLGKKIVVLNRNSGKIQKAIPLKDHFSAKLSCTENRITVHGKNSLLIIGETQKKKNKRDQLITINRYGHRSVYYSDEYWIGLAAEMKKLKRKNRE